MKEKEEIVWHCSATREGNDIGVAEIDKMHSKRFRKQTRSGKYCGYNLIVRIDGSIEYGRFFDEIGAHCPPNSGKIGCCYIGGLDRNFKPKDTRTPAQKATMLRINDALTITFPTITKISGHRDHSPDLNHNGTIEKVEWIKSCPCFEVSDEYKITR
jgi:N-acetylmuramoyl-L-alanine amidase